ncbi:MAG: hypothetical protein VW683_10315 [Betaproteobacteria bacterium]
MVCASVNCTTEIPEGRYELGYHTCIECNDEQPYLGLLVYDHKTAGRLEIFNPNNNHEREMIRQAARFNERAR